MYHTSVVFCGSGNEVSYSGITHTKRKDNNDDDDYHFHHRETTPLT